MSSWESSDACDVHVNSCIPWHKEMGRVGEHEHSSVGGTQDKLGLDSEWERAFKELFDLGD
jgi:hypothetical protein